MALDLSLKIGIEGAQDVQTALRGVEDGIKKVEKANQAGVTWWQKEEQAIDKVTGTVAEHRAELSNTEKAYAKMGATMGSAEITAAKLGSTSATTTAALSGMSGATRLTAHETEQLRKQLAANGNDLSKVSIAAISTAAAHQKVSAATLDYGIVSELVSGKLKVQTAQIEQLFLRMAGGGPASSILVRGLSNVADLAGLSATATLGLTGAVTALTGAVLAGGAVLASAARFHFEHADAMKGARGELDDLTESWREWKNLTGAAILGPEAPLIGFFRLLETSLAAAGAKLITNLALAREFAGWWITSTTGIDLTPLGAPDAPTGNGRWEDRGSRRRDYSDFGAPDPEIAFLAQFPDGPAKAAKARIAAMKEEAAIAPDVAHALELLAIAHRQQAAALALETAYFKAATKASSDYLQQLPTNPVLLQGRDLSGIVPQIGGAAATGGNLAGRGGGGSATGGGDSLTDRLFGSLGAGLSQTLQGLMVNQGSTGGAIGGSIGSSIMGSLMGGSSGKAITGALSKALGGTMGKAFGAAIPILGEIGGQLLGSLIGKLFGETQGHKDLMAGNKQIDEMKAGLGSVYGSAGGAKAAGSIFGVDLSAAWNSQNLAGAEHFKGLIAELSQKQATFNKDLGGTLGKIRELGGNIPEALRPYLQQLTDAKVLTQDNLDLVAKMASGSEVDFKKMEEAAARYGISVDALGQAFKDDKMHQSWQQIIDDMDLLQRGGADMNGVLDGMQDEINALVNQSMHFGTTIPENMKPWIQTLIDSGKLLGANGEAITDINSLTFGDSMQTSLEKLNATLQELIDTLSMKLPAAARDGAAGVRGAFDGMQFPDPIGKRYEDSGPDPGVSSMRVSAMRASSRVPVRIELQGRALWDGLIDVARG